MSGKTVTCIAPINIAVIKYWGKRDEELILPINDSISCTLSTEFMRAKTTIMASPLLKENKFWLNGKEQDFDHPRLQNCLKEVKKRSNSAEMFSWNIHICSENNFPTAAGLASSAAGFACLVTALTALFDVKGEITSIARQGSGSACRSLYGGWVQWFKGTKSDGSDSIARQLFPVHHWPEMRILILVVNDARKKYSSTDGMRTSVATSTLINHRAEVVVPQRVQNIIASIERKNFEEFGRITMQDSNQFHAICMDTFPPCTYLNDVSYSIINVVHAYNDFKGTIKAAYTFDAGPNACIYLLEQDVEEFMSLINYIYPPAIENSNEYLIGIPLSIRNNPELAKSMNLTPYAKGQLKYIIHTKSGEGAEILNDPTEHLLTENGQPKY